MSGFAPRVKAVLGPTNTGKTHLAIERLLGHASGIIGFPLRLLARENYDRMVEVKGARHVALITGEEKIVPPGARYFSCTVEAMPLDRPVEFIAVDEIQLCADPDRGHIFTDRLLNARGLVETMFLGAETISKLLRRLVPCAEIETRPRLSQLTYTGPAKLSRLPPRTAIVAFSAAEVYAIAEAVRSRRGGCAVVMGRLSPRTRNAQVALYQEKEVDFLVATDAIGMGLNMDVDHVAFAGVSKFDGRRSRALLAAEIAQIAGRAGRGMRNGSFGSASQHPLLTNEIVNAVESHVFEPIERLAWRNAALDFSSVDALLVSLAMQPDRPGLARGHDAIDFQTLATLASDPSIHAAAASPHAVQLLWQACQIPDFRKLATDAHARLCARVFNYLRENSTLPEGWVASQISGLGRTDGDIDTLMQRLTEVRVLAYIAARADWVRNAFHWQTRAREAEDLLSDALHEKLMARFVDRRAAKLTRGLTKGDGTRLHSIVAMNGEVVVEGHSVGRVNGFLFEADSGVASNDARLVFRAARRALASEIPRRIAALRMATDEAFNLTPQGNITWQGARIAKLFRGSSMLTPAIEVIDSEFLDGSGREVLRSRLARFVNTRIRSELPSLFVIETATASRPEIRGLAHQLVEEGGVMSPVILTREQRVALKKYGIRVGRFAIFLPPLLKPRPTSLRALLWSVWHGSSIPQLPPPGRVSIGRAAWPEGFALTMGWIECQHKLVRMDVAEKIAGSLASETRSRTAAIPRDLAMRLGINLADLPAVLRGLGFQLLPPEPVAGGAHGPDQSARITARVDRRRRRPKKAAPSLVSPDHPFAALLALKRAAS